MFLALLLVALVALLDYWSAPELSFAVFYVLPIALAAWKVGAGSGFLLSVISAAVWWWGAVSESNPTQAQRLISYWNGWVWLSFFSLMVLLIWRIKRLNRSLGDKATSLAAEVAERERAEAALAASQRIFRLITENVSDLIALLDLQGRTIYCSPSYQLLPSHGAVPGADYFAEIALEDRARVREVFAQVVQTGRNRRTEYRMIWSGEPVHCLESEWSLVREARGAAGQVVVVSRDVTLRKRLEELYANEKDLLELIARGKPLVEVLHKLIQKIEAWSGHLVCSILVHDADHNPALHVGSARLTDPAEPILESRSENAPAGLDRSEALFTPSFSLPRSPRAEWDRFRENAASRGFQVVCEKQIVSTLGEELGALTIYSPEGPGAESLRLQLFEKITHVTAIALERQHSEETLRRLSQQILHAQEGERRRVARELHDGVNQLLSSAAFRVESVLARVPTDLSDLRQDFGKIRFLLQRAIHEVRGISENLRPSELDELGLAAAIRDLCEDFKDRTERPVDLKLPAAAERFESDTELALYRITQEALTNIEKHASASEVGLELQWNQAWISLRIRDNGKGMAPKGLMHDARRGGMGLMDMRERCASLGGHLSIRSESNFGTEIAVRVPRRALVCNGKMAS